MNTPEDISKLDAVLTRTQGNREHAATILGWKIDRVHGMIRRDPGLKQKWSNALADPPEADDPADEIDRDLVPAPMRRIAESIENQDKKVALGKIGLRKEDSDFMMSLSRKHAGNLKTAMGYVQGGITYSATVATISVRDILDKLHDIEENPSKYEVISETKYGTVVQKSAHTVWIETMNTLNKFLETQRKITQTVMQGTETLLKVRKLESDIQNKIKKAAPGWAAPGETVDAETAEDSPAS